MAQKGSEGQAPLKGLRIEIAIDQREILFTRLREFAQSHNFAYDLTFYDKDKKIFLVALQRDDLEIRVVDTPKDPTQIRLSFYKSRSSDSVSPTMVDTLFGELKRSISEIPNVRVTEE